MAEGPNIFDLGEVDEPTHPFTRRELELLAQQAATDGEWCEVGGRRMNVSLDALAHIGLSGTPAGMITCGSSAWVSGEIGPPAAPVAAITADSDESPLVPTRRGPRWAGAVLMLAVGVGIGLWLPTLLDSAEEEPLPIADGTPAAAVPEEPPPTPVVLPVDPSPPSPRLVLPPLPIPEQPSKSRIEADGAVCSAHRRNAEAALREGDWSGLERLARRTRCWSKPAKAKALLLRALFELERFEECVELSANDRNKEIAKWQTNCARALR